MTIWEYSNIIPYMMNIDYRSELLNLGARTEKATGLSLKTIGAKAAKDGKFFDRIKDGGGCTVDTYLSVKGWLENALREGAKE